MRISSTLSVTLAAATATQAKPDYAPIKVVRADWYDCWDLAQINLDIGVDAITAKVPSWYYDLRTAEQTGPDALGNTQQSYCQGGLSLDIKRGVPGNWKFRIMDYTMSGSAKTTGNATIDMWKAQLYMDYWTAEDTPYQTIRKSGRRQYLANMVLRDVVGADGDFNSKFSVTSPQYINMEGYPRDAHPWSPCFGKAAKIGKNDLIDLWFYNDIAPIPYNPATDAPNYDLAIGAKDGKSDIELRWGIEWAECDPAKEPNSAWGEAYSNTK